MYDRFYMFSFYMLYGISCYIVGWCCTRNLLQYLDLFRIENAIWCYKTCSPLIQIMGCCLKAPNHYHEPMMTFCQMHPEEQTSVKSKSSTNIFLQEKVLFLLNGSHLFQAQWVKSFLSVLKLMIEWHLIQVSYLSNYITTSCCLREMWL